MKTFKQLIAESKDRFIKKNKNLSKAQQKQVIQFFKTNRQAEKKVDWQNSEIMTWEDFEDIMILSASGRKQVVKHKNISGVKEKTDYVRIKLSKGRKDFLAYAIQTYEGSIAVASKSVGACRGHWCVANDDDEGYWKDYALRDQDVFVYVINNSTKWAVQIHEGNRNFTIWDAGDHTIKDDGIPNFDVEKELLTSSLKSLYNNIRSDYPEYEEEEYGKPTYEVIQDWDNLIAQMKLAEDEVEAIRDEYEENNTQALDKTLEKYEDLLEKKSDELSEAEDNDASKEEIDRLTEEQEELEEIVNDLDCNYYEAHEVDATNIEWVGNEPYHEEWIYEQYDYMEHYPNYPDQFEDYADWCIEIGYEAGNDDIKQAIWSYIFEGDRRSPEDVLYRENLQNPHNY